MMVRHGWHCDECGVQGGVWVRDSDGVRVVVSLIIADHARLDPRFECAGVPRLDPQAPLVDLEGIRAKGSTNDG
jgi:hypothetical protein